MTLTLAERPLQIRQQLGYGGPRQAAEFARRLGIKPPSLHDLESGATKSVGAKTLAGYIRLGANADFILYGKGAPLVDPKVADEIREVQAVMVQLNAKNRKRVSKLALDLALSLLADQPAAGDDDDNAPPGGGSGLAAAAD